MSPCPSVSFLLFFVVVFWGVLLLLSAREVKALGVKDVNNGQSPHHPHTHTHTQAQSYPSNSGSWVQGDAAANLRSSPKRDMRSVAVIITEASLYTIALSLVAATIISHSHQE